MDESTPPTGRSGGLRPERARIEALMAENRQLREQLDALTREYAGVTGLLANAQGISDLAGSISALTFTIGRSMDDLVQGIGPLETLRALVPERNRDELARDEAEVLQGIQQALARPQLDTPAGLKRRSESGTTSALFDSLQETAE